MISNWLGRRYTEALRKARCAGEAPERIRVICPPWQALGVGVLRLVGCRQEEQGTTWILAYPDYLRVPESEDEQTSRRKRRGRNRREDAPAGGTDAPESERADCCSACNEQACDGSSAQMEQEA